jgi:hypothetical protein
MRLIGFAVLLTVSLFAVPLASEAQQARMVKIGWLLPDPKPFAIDPFRPRLKELGWSEGGNLVIEQIQTGELTPKRVQLLKEAVTGMVRLAILEDFTNPTSDARLAGNWQAIEAASRQLGIRLLPTLEIRKSEELDAAFARAVRERSGGALVLASPFFSSQHQRIASLAANARLPAIYEHRGFSRRAGSCRMDQTTAPSSASSPTTWTRFYEAPSPPISRWSSRHSWSWL